LRGVSGLVRGPGVAVRALGNGAPVRAGVAAEDVKRAARRGAADVGPVARAVWEGLRRHSGGVHANAIAYRVLVSLVPLTLLGVGLLGVLGLEDVWTKTIFPALEERLSRPSARATDYVVSGIFEREGPLLISLAGLLFLYHTAIAVRICQRALNGIHETTEQRGRRRALAVVVALAVAVDLLFLAALLTVVVGGRVENLALEIVRWPVAVLLVGVGVGLLLRYAPAEQPDPRWASAGSALIVAGWLAASALFGFWVTSVASYKSAIGSLVAFLVLTTYTLTVSLIFVVGAELDETLRVERGRE
jgi:membrane protein